MAERRSEVVRKLGYFDEDLFAYYEEVDLIFKGPPRGLRAPVSAGGGRLPRRRRDVARGDCLRGPGLIDTGCSTPCFGSI
jgi:hypothetical protein